MADRTPSADTVSTPLDDGAAPTADEAPGVDESESTSSVTTDHRSRADTASDESTDDVSTASRTATARDGSSWPLIDDVIASVRHCIEVPADGPVVSEGITVRFDRDDGNPTTVRATLAVARRRVERPAPTDPGGCGDRQVATVARFLAQHTGGEWRQPVEAADVVRWTIAPAP